MKKKIQMMIRIGYIENPAISIEVPKYLLKSYHQKSLRPKKQQEIMFYLEVCHVHLMPSAVGF